MGYNRALVTLCTLHCIHITAATTATLHNSIFGCAIAQAVSRRLPTAVSRVRAQVRSCVICGGQNDPGEGFLLVLRFPLPIFIPLTAAYSLIILLSTLNNLDIESVVK
jgi:hypothetical protein